MKTHNGHFVLALLLLPSTVFAQFDNPDRQDLWERMQKVAPTYEKMIACNRYDTANLVWKRMKSVIWNLSDSHHDFPVAREMWENARAYTAATDHNMLMAMERNPTGEVCNILENDVIMALNRGV